MHRYTRLLSAVFLLALLAGCASTSIQDSWTAPDTGPLRFNKTLVVFVSPNQGTRRAAEDRLVSRFERSEAVSSYTLFPTTEGLGDDEAGTRAKVEAEGFDGAIVLRVIDSKDKLTYTQGMSYPMHYGGFYGYYGYGWGMAYSPGYMRTDTIVTVETTVYSIADDKLVWAGVTETFNPNQISQMVDDIASAVAKELRSQGLID